jgi:putative Holliday junction resolvase
MATSLRPSPSPASTPSVGVILAIDYGQKRLGLAVSDEHQLASRPYATWTRTNRRRDLARLRELVRQMGISKIVVGLPLHLDGSPSEMSDEAKKFAARVAKAMGLPVEMMDERLSSWEAHETMSSVRPTKRSGRRAAARSGASQQRPLDKIAAAIILRDYLGQMRARHGSRA